MKSWGAIPTLVPANFKLKKENHLMSTINISYETIIDNIDLKSLAKLFNTFVKNEWLHDKERLHLTEVLELVSDESSKSVIFRADVYNSNYMAKVSALDAAHAMSDFWMNIFEESGEFYNPFTCHCFWRDDKGFWHTEKDVDARWHMRSCLLNGARDDGEFEDRLIETLQENLIVGC